MGQTIDASGVVKISAGVDLTKLSANDVEVTDQKITINLPKTAINSTEILNGINLKNKQGILKRIFDNDDAYNTAFETLRIEAMKSVQSTEFTKQTQDSASDMIKKLVGFIEKNKEVVVNFK